MKTKKKRHADQITRAFCVVFKNMDPRVLLGQREDLTSAERTNLQRPVLITVPHAYSAFLKPGHPRDFAAQEAAWKLSQNLEDKGVRKIKTLVGDSDRTLEQDLNRGGWDDDGQVEAWIRSNPDGILLDVHSFPKKHSWKNPTVVLSPGDAEKTHAPLVILLPVRDPEFALSFQRALGSSKVQTYQGSGKNKIVNLGIERSVLLEFHEGKEDEWPIEGIADVVWRHVA